MRMLERLKSTVAMSGSLSAALLLTLSLPAAAQTTSASKDGTGTNSDALPFLNEVFELYAHANSYHINSIEESTLEGEFSRFWTKLMHCRFPTVRPNGFITHPSINTFNMRLQLRARAAFKLPFPA